MAALVLLRHGQSQWNLENRFTGWTDVPLTPQGEADAARVGEALKDMKFDLAFTSELVRAQKTLEIVLATLGQSGTPVERDKALNERHYGDLQGLNKAETAEKYGQEQVKLWRRSFETRPPNGESHADCEARVMPYFHTHVMPLLKQGKNVLIAAHGNSLRPIIKYFDKLEPEVAATLEIGLCTPYIYVFEGETMVKKEIREVPGIVTKAASTTEKRVSEGRVNY